MNFTPPWSFFLIKYSTHVFEQLSPPSLHSKQQVQHSVVDVAAAALRVELPKGGPEQSVLQASDAAILPWKGIRESPNFLEVLCRLLLLGESPESGTGNPR